MKTPHLQNATITRRAYAKINTYLEVLRQRTDGYHELCSHMQLISLHDTLQLCMKVEDGEGLSLSLTCDNAMLSCGEDNLILKAARAYFSQLTLPQCNLSLHIALQKNIPMQGGLAGGSADAAAALLALNELCGMPMCEQELCDLGARLGADIPFCIRGLQGAQTARGIGERMTAAPGVSEEVTLLVVSPGTAVSTPAAFRLLDERYGDADANAREIENELRYTKHLQALCDGESVMLFPEAGHQDKRWLGTFKIAYLKIAFDAAEKFEFKRDVKILPSCNHYANYFHARTDMLIRFGDPISLMPYYEKYKENPRATMLEINEIVREKIKELMLHIDDLEHYDQIDFLRETGYGRKYAIEHGFKFNYLPSRLLSDQKLVSALQDATAEHPEEMEAIYKDTAELSDGLKKLGIRDWLFIRDPKWPAAVLRGLGLILLLPLFLVSIIPTGLLFLIPKVFIKKLIKDSMFNSSFHVGVSVFVSVPICFVLPIVLLWVFANFWWALGYMVAFPFMFVLAWNYMRLFLRFKGTCIFVKRSNRPVINKLRDLRKSIYNRLDNLLK